MEFLILIGLLWLVGAIFGNKTPRAPPLDPKVEAETRANAALWQAAFDEKYKRWIADALAFAGQGRWVAKGKAQRFLASHPAPTHQVKSWRQAVGDASPAVWRRTPAPGLILHSDQGSQFTGREWQAFLEAHGIVCSMSHWGSCHDNAVAESFFQLRCI